MVTQLLTLMTTVLRPVQPKLVPVKVYVDVVAGVTVIAELVWPLGLQLYVLAPEPVNVILPPKHKELEVEPELESIPIPTIGRGFTVTKEVAVAAQPLLEPVTVYVDVVPGLTEIDVLVWPPGLQE
jgi:hypothetical protein